MRTLVAPIALAALAACSRGDPAAKHRLFARDQAAGEAAAFDPAKPETALQLDADEVARRLGAFEWSGAVEWTVARDGDGGGGVHVTEQHKLRQAATGEFEVRADVNPGLGANAVAGKQVVWVNGMTYARALPAPFRERPTDRGRDARRYREDSFGLVRSVAAMIPALRMEQDGTRELLGRQALHYKLTLGNATPRPPVAAPAGFQAKDADTAARQGFLRDAVCSAAEGELLVDAQTGAPLSARLSATFLAPAPAKGAAPEAKVVVSSQLTALGGEVKAIAAPEKALPDERKPAGPSAALEAAGLKKRGEEQKAAEPADEAE
jgi:hypothetical protein